MNQIFQPVPVCRPALPMDKPAMIALTARIWDGGDYLPYVWDRWLAEPDGVLAVTELAGQIVGIGKLTHLTAEQWWLEGLRTHPDFEGRGLASHMTDYLLAVWQRSGGRIIRLTTASERVAVHRLSEKRGFIRKGEYSFFRAPGLAESTVNFQPIHLEEISMALELTQLFSPQDVADDFIDIGWRWAKPSRSLLETAVRTGKAWWWQGRRGILTWWEDDEEDEVKPSLSLVACDANALPDLLMDARRLAAQLGYSQLAWNAPLQTGNSASVQSAGFRQTWDVLLYLYEKSVD